MQRRTLMEFYTHSPKETEAVGARLGSALSPGSVVAYFGGLGMAGQIIEWNRTISLPTMLMPGQYFL